MEVKDKFTVMRSCEGTGKALARIYIRNSEITNYITQVSLQYVYLHE